MKKSSIGVNLFRTLIVGSAIFLGGYTIAQGIMNSNKENVNIGPYTVTFRLDNADDLTSTVCEEALENGDVGCGDRKVTAYYQDNFQTIDVPEAGKDYPYYIGHHIEWDLDNLYSITDSVIVKGRYVKDEILHKVNFYLDYDKEAPIGYIFVSHGESPTQDDLDDYRAQAEGSYQKPGFEFVGFTAFYSSEREGNRFLVEANYGEVKTDIDIVINYMPKSIKVSFFDENHAAISGADKNVLYNTSLGSIPQSVTDALNAARAKDDAYYYLAHFNIEDGVFVPDNEAITEDSIVKSDGTYNIGIFKKDVVTVTFKTTYMDQTVIDTKSFMYADKYVLKDSDFEGIKTISSVGIEVTWPKADYVGRTVDSDIVIEALVNVKKVNVSYKVMLEDINNPGTYSDITSEFSLENEVLDYNSTLTNIPDVNSLLEYTFSHFTVSTDPTVEYTYQTLVSYHFKRDTEITIYYARRKATVTFNGATDALDNPLKIETYIGAPNVILPYGSTVRVPEGKYFTNKWNYSYVSKHENVQETINKVYDSSSSTDTISVYDTDLVLNPEFKDILVNVKVYDRDQVTLLKEFTSVKYGTDLTRDFDDIKPVKGDNEDLIQWKRFDEEPGHIDCSYNNIKGFNGETIKFYPEFETTEYRVVFKNDDGTEIAGYTIDGTKTVNDYISQLTTAGISATVPDGYEFDGWTIYNDQPLTYVVPNNSNFSITAKKKGKEYDVKFNFEYHLSLADGTNTVETQSFTTTNKVTIGKALDRDYDALKEAALILLNTNTSSVSGLSSLDNYTISTNFSSLNNQQILNNTPIAYSSDSISSDSGTDYFNLYLRIVPKTVTVNYLTMTIDGYGRYLGISKIYSENYTYMSDTAGYQVVLADHFGEDKLLDSTRFKFVGWHDDAGNEYNISSDRISNSHVTGNITLVAKYKELRPIVRIFGPKTELALDSQYEIDNSTFNSNYTVVSELATTNGDNVSLNNEDLKKEIILYIGQNLATASSTPGFDDVFTLGENQYQITGIRHLGKETETVMSLDDFFNKTITSIQETENYILVLTKVI